METYGNDDEMVNEDHIPIYPRIAFYDINDVKETLYHFLTHMNCTCEGCTDAAVAMCRVNSVEKDLRCPTHLGLVENRSLYKELKGFWDEIENMVDNMIDDVMQAQVMISTMESKYYKNKLNSKELDSLEKAKDKLKRILITFRKRVLGTKRHANFDVFAELDKEGKVLSRDVNQVHQIIGPLLSKIYSTAVFNKLSAAPIPEPKEEKKIKEEDKEDREEVIEISEAISEVDMRTAFYAKDLQELIHSAGEPPREKALSIYNLNPERKRLVDMPETSLINTVKIKSVVELDKKEPSMITVFAALKDDLKNPGKNFQDHIDFLFTLRDMYAECREEIDQYIDSYKLKPSKKYAVERVIPNGQAIQSLLQLHKLDKTPNITPEYVLKLDIRNKKKECQKFFEEVCQYQMPKIKQLMLEKVNKINANMFPPFEKFLTDCMVSPFREFNLESGKEIVFAQFNNVIKVILKRVTYATTFRYFIFTDNDAKTLFENLNQIKHIEFIDCSFVCLTDSLRIVENEETPFELRSLIFTAKNKKMSSSEFCSQMKYLVKALSLTNIVNTLKIVQINNPYKADDVKELFTTYGFDIDLVQPSKCNPK